MSDLKRPLSAVPGDRISASDLDGRVSFPLYNNDLNLQDRLQTVDDELLLRVRNYRSGVVPDKAKEGDRWIDLSIGGIEKVCLESYDSNDLNKSAKWEVIKTTTLQDSEYGQIEELTSRGVAWVISSTVPESAGKSWIRANPDNANQIEVCTESYASTDGPGDFADLTSFRQAKWTESRETRARIFAIAVEALSSTVLSTYYQGGVPSEASTGDQWVDTSDSNTVRLCAKGYAATDGGGSDDWRKERWMLVDNAQASGENLPSGSERLSFYSSTLPSSADVGDLWIDNSSSLYLVRRCIVAYSVAGDPQVNWEEHVSEFERELCHHHSAGGDQRVNVFYSSFVGSDTYPSPTVIPEWGRLAPAKIGDLWRNVDPVSGAVVERRCVDEYDGYTEKGSPGHWDRISGTPGDLLNELLPRDGSRPMTGVLVSTSTTDASFSGGAVFAGRLQSDQEVSARYGGSDASPGSPSQASDLTTKAYVDAADNLKISSSEKGAEGGVASLLPNGDPNAGKIPDSQLPDYVLKGMKYAGTWNASSGSAPSATPAQGDYYIVTAAGTWNGTEYEPSDWVVYDGTEPYSDFGWDKIDNSESGKMKVSLSDTTFDFLDNKLSTAEGIQKAKLFPGMAETVQLALNLALLSQNSNPADSDTLLLHNGSSHHRVAISSLKNLFSALPKYGHGYHNSASGVSSVSCSISVPGIRDTAKSTVIEGFVTFSDHSAYRHKIYRNAGSSTWNIVGQTQHYATYGHADSIAGTTLNQILSSGSIVTTTLAFDPIDPDGITVTVSQDIGNAFMSIMDFATVTG